jgi:predicted DNA-binding antitoxin AbrB/MazE fold protein
MPDIIDEVYEKVFKVLYELVWKYRRRFESEFRGDTEWLEENIEFLRKMRKWLKSFVDTFRHEASRNLLMFFVWSIFEAVEDSLDELIENIEYVLEELYKEGEGK